MKKYIAFCLSVTCMHVFGLHKGINVYYIGYKNLVKSLEVTKHSLTADTRGAKTSIQSLVNESLRFIANPPQSLQDCRFRADVIQAQDMISRDKHGRIDPTVLKIVRAEALILRIEQNHPEWQQEANREQWREKALETVFGVEPQPATMGGGMPFESARPDSPILVALQNPQQPPVPKKPSFMLPLTAGASAAIITAGIMAVSHKIPVLKKVFKNRWVKIATVIAASVATGTGAYWLAGRKSAPVT